MDRIPINFALMAHPANWVIILLMVWIAGLALALLFKGSHILPQPGDLGAS